MNTFNQTKACNVRDVPAAAFIAAYAEHLKRSGKIELPKNHEIMKTCVHNELSPLNDDWYYIKTGILCVEFVHLPSRHCPPCLPPPRNWYWRS